MDSQEFTYWRAIHEYIEPIGGNWEQTALLASVIANSAGRIMKKKLDPDAFLPIAKQRKSAAEMFHMLTNRPVPGGKPVGQEVPRSHGRG